MLAPVHSVPVQSFSVHLALAAITWYQRRVSPHKGWCCAHRACHGRSSCSQWIKRAVARRGLRRGAMLACRRFSHCHTAAVQLRAASPGATVGHPKWANRDSGVPESRWETEEDRKVRNRPGRSSTTTAEDWLTGTCCFLADPNIACCLLGFLG